MPITICVITGSRADWGLLEPVVKSISEDDNFKLHLVVTGNHFFADNGNTFHVINYTYHIVRTQQGLTVSQQMGQLLVKFDSYFKCLPCGVVLLLGDRYEILMAATAAHMNKIPIAHLHGGEVSKGAWDDAFRHSITKMSHLHFAATSSCVNRIVQLGENPNTVFCIGPMASVNLDGRKKKKSDRLDQFIIIYHPETLGDGPGYLIDLLRHLRGRKEKLIFILPNSDEGSKEIMEIVHNFLLSEEGKLSDIGPRIVIHRNMPRDAFIEELSRSKAIIGNSSCGIIEAPLLEVPTINIGNRQSGREMASSVINCCSNDYQATILQAFSLFDYNTKNDIFDFSYPPYKCYVDPVGRILMAIKRHMKHLNIQKGFYDLR